MLKPDEIEHYRFKLGCLLGSYEIITDADGKIKPVKPEQLHLMSDGRRLELFQRLINLAFAIHPNVTEERAYYLHSVAHAELHTLDQAQEPFIRVIDKDESKAVEKIYRDFHGVIDAFASPYLPDDYIEGV